MASTVESQTRWSSKLAVPDESYRSPTTASEYYSLLDAVDSESTAEQFDIGLHNEKHDHRKFPLRIAKRRVVRTLLYADWVRAAGVVPALPPVAGWRAGGDPETSDTVESIVALVRLNPVGRMSSPPPRAVAFSNLLSFPEN